MAGHIDYNDPKYREAAAAILQRHDAGEPEANITSAVRDFLIVTGLVNGDEIIEEDPPADASRRAVDLTALDTFIELKRRIGTASGGAPNPQYVEQLDDYLVQSEKQGRVRMGVLTDGKRWLLRWSRAGEVWLTRPYAFTLDNPDGWLSLYEWLRDEALVSLENISPDSASIARYFGPGSPSYQRDIDALKALYQENAGLETIKIKRQLWHDLLHTALGEIAGDSEEMDDLFVRHSYLGAVIGMVVQSSFGIDIRSLAENDPADLLQGRKLHHDTGLHGVLESDFFAWPNEVGGTPLLRTIARRVARFEWTEAPADTAATLYESVIPPEERWQLGEYYTPSWLARAMIRELVDDPLNQRVLDPACGSGTFLAEAVAHFIAAAKDSGWEAREILNKLREAVTGIDVHPVAVHLARAAWTLAARPAINEAGTTASESSLSIPVYLGDALQLRFRTGDMFAENEITIQTSDEENTELVFPTSLVERAEDFDALMGDISAHIEQGDDPLLALDDNHIRDPIERKVITNTIAVMQDLHRQGRDHIWAYYSRNMVRPVALSRARVDVVIGNPPWINYNQTADILRDELQNLSRNRYGIWAGGRFATHQDVAGLFFARSIDLYLKNEGVIGFIMPHSALQAGHYAKWRSGKWQSPPQGRGKKRASAYTLSVTFDYKPAWDLERLQPNTFFPIPASAVFARKLSPDAEGKPLAGTVERWRGKAGAADVQRESSGIVNTGALGESPYGGLSRQGATIVPRCFFFVSETQNTAVVQAVSTVTVNPRRGNLDKTPWKDLDLTDITGQTVEDRHLFNVHLGETIAPYVALEPLKALLPVKQGDAAIPIDAKGPGGVRLGGLDRRMRQHWQTVSRLWEENKALANRLNLLERLDYVRNLSAQLEWRHNPNDRPVRVVYTKAGEPTAALIEGNNTLVDHLLYWIPCRTADEGNYLLAIVNSDALQVAVQPLMSKGQFGARDLHKHLWKLTIPEFDPAEKLHLTIAKAGAVAAAGAKEQLAVLRKQRGEKLTVNIVRRELRKWLGTSKAGKAVETAVGKLLASG